MGQGLTGKTANGERFDCEALTAAHPNLPFRVHRPGWLIPGTGKFELVRINDRRSLSRRTRKFEVYPIA